MEMRLGIASWSFILCALLLFLIAQDSGARKIARDIQLKVSYDLQKFGTDGLVVSSIIQAEGAGVETNKKHVKKDDEEDDHKRTKRKYVNKDEDADEDDEDDHKKIKRKYVNKNEDDDDDHKKNKGKRVHKDDGDDEEEDDEDVDKDKHKKIKGREVHAYKSSHMDHNHMDPELNVFFTPTDLKIGKKMPIYFAQKDPSSSPKFLPREEVDQIPFSSKQLHSLLKFFSFSKHSAQAKAMKYTLKQCEFEPMIGEIKFCATSLESLLDFAHSIFGPNAQFKAIATTHLTNSTVPLQNYTISEVKEISVPKVIGCHPMPYPYAVFYCHSQERDTGLFEVLVEGENGGRVQAAAICHMDTSKWNRDHVSFSVLKVEPGSSPVCHFFPTDNLVWVPLPPADL